MIKEIGTALRLLHLQALKFQHFADHAQALMLLNDARKGVFCCPNFRTYDVVDCIQATGASGPKNEKERRQRIWI